MSGFRLESGVKAIHQLSFARFPTKPFNGRIVRQDDIVIGKPAKGWNIYTTYGSRYHGGYARSLVSLSNQAWGGGITSLLKGLIKLGEITKLDMEEHQVLLRKENERRHFENLCRELVSFTENDKILQKIAHHNDENLESLLTSDNKKEREFASAIIRLRKVLV